MTVPESVWSEIHNLSSRDCARSNATEADESRKLVVARDTNRSGQSFLDLFGLTDSIAGTCK